MREDTFTNTEHDAGLYEQRRSVEDVDDRPTRMEAERDKADWKPGDPCCSCGSTDTVDVYDGPLLLGAKCNGCKQIDWADD